MRRAAPRRSITVAKAVGISARAFDVLGSVIAVIQDEFNISQAAVSQHLNILRPGGFARARIEGSRRIYSVDSKPLQEVDAWLDQFRGFWEQRLKALTVEIARGKRERASSRSRGKS